MGARAPYSAALDEVETDDSGPDAPDGGSADDASAQTEGGTPRRRRRRRRRGRGRSDAGATDASAQPGGTPPEGTQPEGAQPQSAAAQPSAQSVARPQHDRSHAPSGARGPGASQRDAKPRDRDRPRPQRDELSHEDPRSHDPSPRPPSREAAAFASLSAGLFSHLDDREVGCKIEGCARTWTWTAAEQIQAFGQPPPKRMCAEHYAAFHTVADREIACQNPWCEHTWTWTKAAQLTALSRERGGSIEPPVRTCDQCAKQERDLADAEVACRVDGCRRTWTWTREAQLKHRMWLRHAGTREDEAPEERGGRRRRHRRGRATEGPPPRMCEPCRQRQAKLVERETTCRVHGCTRTVTVDREAQLRAWAQLGTDDVNVEAPLPKRMCDVCREFCRLHPDREVPCGRPGCERSWTFKTGAQLQAFLAGRFEDPLRLCGHCVDTGHLRAHEVAIEGAEIMPCIVPLCDGIWHYVPSMSIAAADDGDLPLDRMCDRCRTERGASPRHDALVASSSSADDGEPHDEADRSTNESYPPSERDDAPSITATDDVDRDASEHAADHVD